MVARNNHKTKWRHSCAFCHTRFSPPRTYAYCNKKCERLRRNRDENHGDADDARLLSIHEQRLQLLEKLEVAPNASERQSIQKHLVQLDACEATTRHALSVGTDDRGSVDYWTRTLRPLTDAFEFDLRRAIDPAIRLGASLIEAKQSLPAGEFDRLFIDSRDRLPRHLPLTAGRARSLMALASNDALSQPDDRCGRVANRMHAAAFPADLQVLVELARVPADRLERAIRAGRVTRTTTREQAKALVQARGGRR